MRTKMTTTDNMCIICYDEDNDKAGLPPVVSVLLSLDSK